MFVERQNGGIVAAYANPQPGIAEEEMAADAPELVAFLARKEDPSAAAKALDDRRAETLTEKGTVEDRLAALELRLKSLGG